MLELAVFGFFFLLRKGVDLIMLKNKCIIDKNPIIAAVRDIKRMEEAGKSPIECIFLMTGDILTIEDCVKTARSYKKSIFLHVDLIKGVANDTEGVKYIAQRVKPDGIVSTKSHLIRMAKKEGLFAVQHFFLIDTHAYETSIRSILETEPDAIEIMPGLMPRVIADIKIKTEYPIVAAGLVKSRREAKKVIDAGAHAVAIGEPELWTLNL